MPWATKLAGMRPFHVMEVLQRASELEAQGREIVHLEVGEPDFPTPEPVLAAAREALAQDLTRYTPALGIPELRAAVAAWYRRQYGVELDPRRVILTPGTSGAFVLAFSLLLNPGDRFAISDPGYPCYANMIRLLGGEAVHVPVGPEERYQLSVRALEPYLQRGRGGVLITSPSNPTGTLIDPGELAAVTERVEAAGGTVISDEIYHGVTYGERARSVLEFSQRAIVINGFSKFFAMTGWRLGWMIVPDDAVRQVEILSQNLFISAPTLSQYAALAAFACQEALERQVRSYDINRRFLLAELRRLGFLLPVEPTGAFYLYADVSVILKRTGHEDARLLARDLLERAGVAVTPGIDFGQHRCDQHLRFSYAADLERLREGVARIDAFLQSVKN